MLSKLLRLARCCRALRMQHIQQDLQLACSAWRQLSRLQLHLKTHAGSGAQQLLGLLMLTQGLQQQQQQAGQAVSRRTGKRCRLSRVNMMCCRGGAATIPTSTHTR